MRQFKKLRGSIKDYIIDDFGIVMFCTQSGKWLLSSFTEERLLSKIPELFVEINFTLENE